MAVPHDWHVWQWKNWLINRLFVPSKYDNTVIFSDVMGIPPKVEYGREKDTIIRDDRQADPGRDS